MKKKILKSRTRNTMLVLLSISAMVFSSMPIDLFFYTVSAEEGYPPQGKPVHSWDHNIKKINHKSWGYQAITDGYEVKFPSELEDYSAEITATQNEFELKMKIVNIECNNFTGRQNGTFQYETPNKVEPTVDGTKITYADVYTNISLNYEICFHQCKETFIIEELPEGIMSNLIFNNQVEFNTTELSVYCDGTQINDTYFGRSENIEFRDNNGELVYLISKPIIFDTPDKVWDSINGQWNDDYYSIDYLDGSFKVEPSEEGINISYELPYDFLTKETTKFPVYLDPSISPTTITDSITYEGWFNNTIKRTDSSGETFFAGSEIVQNSTVTINDGGTLTLNNITLKINGTNDGDCELDVNDGGTLNVVNCSTITWGTNPANIIIEIGEIASYESTAAVAASDIDISYALPEGSSEEPEGWFVSGVFSGTLTPELIETIEGAATDMNMPTQSLWMILWFGVTVAIGLSVLMFTGSAVITLFIVIALLWTGVNAGVIDFGLVIIVIFMGFGSLYLSKQH